jgi:hypothetical protein
VKKQIGIKTRGIPASLIRRIPSESSGIKLNDKQINRNMPNDSSLDVPMRQPKPIWTAVIARLYLINIFREIRPENLNKKKPQRLRVLGTPETDGVTCFDAEVKAFIGD